MLKCYLIGSMSGLEFEIMNAPRKQFKEKLDIKCANNDYKFSTINPCCGWDFGNFYEYSPKEVVQSNDMFLDQSDIGVIFNNPPLNILTSPGSLYEIYYYKWHSEKPLFMIGNFKDYRPHIMESITKWFKTDDECIQYLIDIYGQLT